MRKKQLFAVVFIFSFIILFLNSCKDILDVEYKDVLTYDENYRNEFDSRSAALGIAGLFQENLADQYVLLGELRGDLVDITTNTDEYMSQIAIHQVDTSNPYINPRKFYEVILSCNDAMENMIIMKEKERVSQDIFDRDYSEVAAFRCWIYYLLAVHFGSVPYITETIEDIDMIENGDFPVLNLNEMIDALINFMSTIPSLEMTGWDISLDNYGSINRAFVDKAFFLADLNLWKGNYREAARLYRTIMDYGNDLASRDKFKTSYYFGYNYPEDGEFNWYEMFQTYIGGISGSKQSREWRWFCIVDNRFDQSNSLVSWFSNSYGQYMLKPSQLSINNWESQHLINGQPGDLRGENASWAYEAGEPVVQKYLSGVQSPYDNDADLFIYRSGNLHLRYAEAANRMGYCDLALALLNTEALNADSAAIIADDYVFRFDSTMTEDGTIEALKTKEKVFKYMYTYGVRGRCYVEPVKVPQLLTNKDSVLYVENIIAQEYALELAYEGERWLNLLRIANRRENEDGSGTGAEFLSEAIAKKYEAAAQTGMADDIRARLSNPDNWFLPLETK
ncbi:MAG: RagB/SusD family nutrient uptake outer membrane protein [Bacteroidales bacterium]|nr:RagB/SusD family nutrient uptake outer membrane protein [Bacteroidales bacterium]